MAPDEHIERKLAAVLYADVAGYSRLTGADEEGTHRQLSASLDFIAESIAGQSGRVIHYAGDAVLAEFASVVVAVQCAVTIQRGLAERNAGVAKDRRLSYRIGINLGDVIVDRDDLYGDGVNVAARLEGLAEAGGICVSAKVRDEVAGKLELDFEDLGQQDFKNIAEPVRAFRVLAEPPSPAAKVARKVAEKMAIKVGPQAPTDRAERKRPRIFRLARLSGALWLVLLVLDVGTGEPFWAHWPGLALATLLAIAALPLWIAGGFALLFARGAVLMAGLALVNAFTWSGELWCCGRRRSWPPSASSTGRVSAGAERPAGTRSCGPCENAPLVPPVAPPTWAR